MIHDVFLFYYEFYEKAKSAFLISFLTCSYSKFTHLAFVDSQYILSNNIRQGCEKKKKANQKIQNYEFYGVFCQKFHYFMVNKREIDMTSKENFSLPNLFKAQIDYY